MVRTIVAFLLVIGLIAGGLAFGLSRNDDTQIRAQVTVAEALGGQADEGYATAVEPRAFQFPADHGPHPEYRTEWWYFTGNLDTAEGRHFGYELTIFRIALTPEQQQRQSEWAAGQIYMAHFAVSDIEAGRFYAFERYSRGALGLAGAQGDPFRVWIEDWSAEGLEADALPMRVRAAQDGVAIDLTLEGGKPPVLQGDRGLSQKGPEAGNASYYYSLTRMPTSGDVTIAGQRFAVSGLSWMDREWSTSALGENLIGWDWFALQLSDGSELMYYQLRQKDGGAAPLSGGTLVAPDGTTSRLSRDQVQLEVVEQWQSPRDGTRYPARWRLRVPSISLDLEITPYMNDQELHLTTRYWEGAVQVEGSRQATSLSGSGYVELTGYEEGSGGRH